MKEQGSSRYSVELPDKNYYEQQISCRVGCPVTTNAGGYVQAIHQGKFNKAYEIASAPNPLASVCGRICAHPCESKCRRGNLDKPVSIRALKRFVTEKYGPEAPVNVLEQVKDFAATFPGALIPPTEKNHLKVAIVGAGPAGLACANDLALFGYDVTIFESSPIPGGMLALGVPEYRLPRDVLRAEINKILNRGVTLKTNWKMGRDFTLKDLLGNGFKSVFLAIGAGVGRTLNIPGVELDGVMNGIDFLLNVNLGYKVELGQRVIIVGGGNVAFDVARTAIRQEQHIGNGQVLIDAARVAVRMGARDVRMVALESREQLPADLEELVEAENEKIQIHCGKGPNKIVGMKGKVIALETVDVLSVFDEEGRFNPRFVPKSESYFPADSIILSIGQSPDMQALSLDKEHLTPKGNIIIDPDTLGTSIPGVYAGGDLAFGPRLAIDAIADGKKAALSIHQFLKGKAFAREQSTFNDTGLDRADDDFEKTSRVPVPAESTNRRTGFREVEKGYDTGEALSEAGRCLYCHVNTIFDSEKCILCGGCVDVCPEFCLTIAPLARVNQDPTIKRLFEQRYGYLLSERDFNGMTGKGALIKDEDKCIRCALCAKRCPTKAITMEVFSWKGEI